MSPRNGEIKPVGASVWREKGLRLRQGKRQRLKERAVGGEPVVPKRKRRISLFWRTRHEERKSETVPMSPVVEGNGGNLHNASLEVKPEEIKVIVPHAVDPWVRRCRVAAVASGVLLAMAVVVAIVVVAGVRA